MSQIEYENVKKKSVSGVLALGSRTFLLQIIAFTATFLLTIFLSPAAFGIFYLVSSFISFLTYFSDIGLAAALIQKKDEIKPEDLSTTFTVQQILVSLLVILAFISSDIVTKYYGLESEGLWLFRSLIVSFFLSSLKIIPSILLERRLAFNLLVIPQIIEHLAFYITVVVLAWKGFGITSFTLAVLARSILGLISIYIVCPWMPVISFNSSVFKRLIRFGIPFQLNSLLALVKDDLFTLMLGKVVSYTELGYIGWAKKWAEVPLRLIMDSVVRVTFPVFSRLQKSRDYLGKAIENTLFVISAGMFAATACMITAVFPLVQAIPRYSKWEPAVIPFILIALASLASSLSVPLTNTLNAIGKIRITLILMIIWTILTWVLAFLFVYLFGFVGVPIAYLVISTTSILTVWLAKKEIKFGIINQIKTALISSIVQMMFYRFTHDYKGTGNLNVVLWLLSGVVLYAVLFYILEKERIIKLKLYIKSII